MGYQANYAARNFTKGAKAMIRIRATDADGVMRCANCTKAVTRATSEVDHIIPWEISRYSGPSNGQLLCSEGRQSCHTIKSGEQDWPLISKNNRVRAGHSGKRRKPRHPFPCGRDSRWMKPVGAIAPVARTTQTERLRAVLARRQILTQRAEA